MPIERHRQIGKSGGELRQLLQKRIARKGQVSQANVAEVSEELFTAKDALIRQVVADIETASSRPVSVGAVARYLETLEAMAAGKTGLPPQPDLVVEIAELRRQLDRRPKEKDVAGSTTNKKTHQTNFLDIPLRTFDVTRSPPGALLRSEYAVVPFHGRETEFRNLLAWCESSNPIGVRLYTGAGGMGKTRLLLELCQQFESKGWRTGFLSATEPTNRRELQRFWQSEQETLIVIDYAETRRDELALLLSELHRSERKQPARVVLLARAATDWWQELRTDGSEVGELLGSEATSRAALKPLAQSPTERRKSFSLAANAFAAALKKKSPDDLPPDLGRKDYERVLILHMRALGNVLGQEFGGEMSILDSALSREERFWRGRAKSLGLPITLARTLGAALATITLAGGVKNETEAIELIHDLPNLRDEKRAVLSTIARLLHDIYASDRWIEPLLPDLLGEHLVQRELGRGGAEILTAVLGPEARGDG